MDGIDKCLIVFEINNFIMKQILKTLAIFFLFASVNAFSQKQSNFIILDQIAENNLMLEKQFIEQKSVFYKTDGIESNAIKQISKVIQTVNVNVLEIYVPTKPGAIVFSSIAILPQNVDEFASELRTWKSHVSKEVIIHSQVVFNGEDGALLKQRLEEITDLIFNTQK